MENGGRRAWNNAQQIRWKRLICSRSRISRWPMANIGLNKRSFSYMRQIAVRNVKLDPVNPLSYLVEWIAPCSVFLVHWAFALTLSRSYRLSLLQTAPEVLVTSNVQIFLIKTGFIVFDLWHSSTGVAIKNNSLTKIKKMLRATKLINQLSRMKHSLQLRYDNTKLVCFPTERRL